MQVTIEYTGQLKRSAGVTTEVFSLEAPCTIRACIGRAADRHGDRLRSLLLAPDGAIHSSILIFVGDEQVRLCDPRELRDRDVVTLLSPISGG